VARADEGGVVTSLREAVIVPGIWAALSVSTIEAQTFRSAVDYVLVDVSVKQNGAAVTGLTPRDFVVVDAGVAQTIASVHAESLPIDVTFVIDLSGSVDGPVLSALTRGIESVRRALGSDDRATVVTFNHAIREHGTIAAGAVAPLSLAPPFGQTSLLDAVTLALIREPQPGRRQMAIVFTDGIDTTSFSDATALLEVARRADAAIFSVAVADRMTRGTVPAHAALLAELSTVTGGALTVMRADGDLSHSFVEAFQEFRKSYVLSYAYQGPSRNGWHPITVRLTKRGSYQLRARQGYFR
jgi:VWFA-related protein